MADVDALAHRYGLSPLEVMRDYDTISRVAQGALAYHRYRQLERL